LYSWFSFFKFHTFSFYTNLMIAWALKTDSKSSSLRWQRIFWKTTDQESCLWIKPTKKKNRDSNTGSNKTMLHDAESTIFHCAVRRIWKLWSLSCDRILWRVESCDHNIRSPISCDHNIRLPIGCDHNIRLPIGCDHNIRLPIGCDHKIRLSISCDHKIRLPMRCGHKKTKKIALKTCAKL